MWTEKLSDILGPGDSLDCSKILISFQYGGILYNSLPLTWEVIQEEQVFQNSQIKLVKAVREPETGLVVTLKATVYPRFPAVEWVVYFENTGQEDTPILANIKPLSAVLPTVKQDPVILHQIHGDKCNEESYLPFDTHLNAGQQTEFQPAGGRSSNGCFPFFNLEHQGQGLIVAIGWSGQWKVSLSRAEEGSLQVKAGMEKTYLTLHPGERIRSPRILLMPWRGDLRDLHNRFRQLMLAYYVPRVGGKLPDIPIAENNFDIYHGHPTWPTEAGQLEFVELVAKCGIDTYWLDAAWFEGGFPNGVGNWFAKPNEFPRGLRPIADAAHEKGMRFLVWFEPGRVTEGTEVMRAHPEWALQLPGRNNGLFNFGNPDARRWMTERIGRLIDEYGIDVYREDFNIDPLEYWRAADPPDRQGMTEIRFIEGFYQFWDDLREARPNLLIDNCSSGGRRIDLETFMRSIPMWRSDTSCGPGHADWDQVQTVGLSQYIPFHLACTHSHQTYDCRSSATIGSVSQWRLLDEDFPFDLARKATDEVRENSQYWLGNFYPLTKASSAPEDWMVFQLHRQDLDAGIIVAFRHEQSQVSTLPVSVRGISPDRTYRVTFSDEERNITVREMRGEEMKSGMALQIPQKRASLLVNYYRVKR